jgi:hypothetical protein
LLGICTLGRQQTTQATPATGAGSGHGTLGQSSLLGSYTSLLFGDNGLLFGQLLTLDCVGFCGLGRCGFAAARQE